MQQGERVETLQVETLGLMEVRGQDSDSARERVEHLERCVDDLLNQNRTLVNVVIELEAETENRVKAAETFLERTAKSAKTYMVALNGHEQFVRNLVRDSSKGQTTIKRLQDKVSVLEEENCALQERNDGLCHDVGSLVRLINHARNTGQWDVGNIDFCEVSFEDVFGSVEQFSDSTSLEELDHLDSVSGILSNSSAVEDGIKTLFGERTSSVRSYSSSARTVSGTRVTRRDAQIHRLQGELRRAQQHVSSVHAQLSDRDQIIAKLQVEIADLNHDMTMKESEMVVQSQTLRLRYETPLKANRSLSAARHWISCDGSPDVVRTQPLEERITPNMSHSASSNNDSKKQELKAVLLGLSHENNMLKRELTLIKSNKATLDVPPRPDVRDADMQADQVMDGGDLSNEICRLRGLEERQRLKAFGLEVVVQQLTNKVESCGQVETQLRTEVHNLKNAQLKVEELNLNLQKLDERIAAKDEELELQRRTIGNLRDTIVALKRHERSHVGISDRKSMDIQKTSFSDSDEKPPNGFSQSLSRTGSKSGEIFDI